MAPRAPYLQLDPKSPVKVIDTKIDGDYARIRISNNPKIGGYLFRKFTDGWQILGPTR